MPHRAQATGRRPVRLRDADGKSIRITIAKLIAITFIANPDKYNHVIFIDRDNANCCVGNLRWVSQGDYIRFIKRCAESDELLGITHRRKKDPDWIDPDRVSVEGYPGYYITRAGILLIKPSQKNIHSFMETIRKVFRKARSMTAAKLIHILNPKIRGWANYHRNVVSKAIFSKIDKVYWHLSYQWANRRHAQKGAKWLLQNRPCRLLR